MSDEKNPASNPNLTPQEQAQAKDTADIQATYGMTNVLENLDELLPFGLGPKGSVFGSTSFDGHRLNAMLDLLDSANPADLEQAGEALEKATKSLNEAAKELHSFVGSVDWKGEAATEFQRYGSEVVTYAWDIGKVANAAGAQMKVASTGLASVRSAAPPRDTRAVQKKPSEFTELEKTEKKEEYEKAVRVEKDRQEAINQMNRLASFYAVSQSTLAGQQMPKPPESYKAAVPPPSGRITRIGESGSGSSPNSGSSRGGALSSESSGPVSAAEDRTTQPMPRTGDQLDGSRPIEERPSDTRVQIDTVATPPAPTLPNNAPPSIPTPTTPNQTGPTPAPPFTLGTPPSAGGPKTTTGPRTATGRTALGRSTGPTTSTATGRSTGGPRSNPAMGRAGNPTSTPATGRSGGPANSPAMGRSGNPASSPATGRSNGPMGRAGGPATAQSAQAGRATPQTGRPGGPAQSAAGRTARTNPIVGGTQQRATSGSTGSRIPRGTVVGGETPAAGRTAGARPSQAGVVGANNGKAAQRPAGRGTPSSHGVVGSPRGMAGRGNQRPDRDEEDRERSSRPDYLTEDEETWTNRRRGAVPPVID